MLALAEKVHLIITAVEAVNGELVVTFSDGSEIALTPDAETLH